MEGHSVIDSVSVKTIKKKEVPGFWSALKKYKFYYLLALPGLLYLIIFKYIPMFGVVIAFKDYQPFMGISGIFTSKWVGFQYFQQFFSSYYFGSLMENTIIISLYKFIFGFPAPIILALMLNEIGNKHFKKITQTISYLPYFISWVVVASLLYNLLSTDNGIINEIRKLFGAEPIMFLGDPKYFRSVLVLSDIWKSIGFGSIIYLAAMTGIDQEQYEAADIDGATRLQKILYITLPSISSIVVIMLILRVGGILDAGFEQIFLLYTPSVYGVGDIIDTFVYRSGLVDNNYAYATAVGLFKSVIAAILLITTNWISKKFQQDGIW